MLTLAAHVSNRSLTRDVLGHVGILIAVVVLSALVYFCYAYAPKITRSISPATAHGILRVVAFILLCIGVQIAWNGLALLLATVGKPGS
jgi:multiple antibiotic resistance protein